MNKITDALNKIFQDHAVVFWYDEEEKMREQFNEVELADIEKIEVTNNEFAVKHRVIRKKSDERFLLYFPFGEKPYEENWLLDLQLAYKEFHTDQEAMLLQQLGLDYYFKELVREHIEFFQSKDRRLKLRDLLAVGDQKKDIQYKMMAVAFNTEYPNLEAFIQSYATAYSDGNPRIERELERFNLKELFWQELSRKFSYHATSPSIYDFLMDVFSRNFILTAKGRSAKESKILLSLWKDAISYQNAFKLLSGKIAEDLQIEKVLHNAALDEIIEDDLFELAEKKIIHELIQLLDKEAISSEKLVPFIKKRENKYWYKTFNGFYSAIEHAGKLTDLVRKKAGLKTTTVEEGAVLYSKELYEIDFHYRKFIYHYRKTNQNRILEPLYNKVSRVYSNDWLLDFNNKWQSSVDVLTQWPVSSQVSQQNFFKLHVNPFVKKGQRLFVVISDALRYECGWEFFKEMQSESRYEAYLEYMITGLPSYTQLGMAALLPHEQLNILPGQDTVIADGFSTQGTPARTKILEEKSGTRAVAINAEDFMKMNAHGEGREFVKQHDLIYIYHNRIDKIGDDKTSEDKVFEAVEDEISYLKDLLRKISNMNGYNIWVTSDHGFIYQHEDLEESDFAEADPSGEVWKASRRFVLGKKLKGSNATKHFNGLQIGLTSEVDILVPKGINRLRVKGAGSRFVHGGASLQEIVVPLVKISKKRQDTTKLVDIDIIKSTDKITTNILAVSFIQNELISDKTLARQLRASIKAEDGTILSDVFTYTFNASEGTERQREVKHRFQLSSQASGKYKNQRVSLVLEEPIEGTSRWKVYKDYHYTLNISFTNDFDDF